MNGDTFYKKYGKRILDVGLSAFSLAVFSPVFAVTAAGIKISSPGPVFYYSERVGKDGKRFHFYKFRSMHITNNEKHTYIADEDRLFAFGRLIRRLKIDELPQLINIFNGDMSIVGPRPMTELGVGMYAGKYEKILSIRPGLTSAASLYDYTVGETYTDVGKYAAEVLPVKQEMELYYVTHEGFRYDAELVLRTMLTILEIAAGKKKFAPQKELSKIGVPKTAEAPAGAAV